MKHGREKTKMRMIALSLSSACVQKPRCSFCYQQENQRKDDLWEARTQLEDILAQSQEKDITISFEYNGYNLGWIKEICKLDYLQKNITHTLTTMPSVVTPIFCGYLSTTGITTIALSYDSQKVSSPFEWVYKAKLLREAGLRVSCNYLIESTLNVPYVILKEAKQLNLLSLKPTGKYEERVLKDISTKIEVYKSMLLVATDNCLGVQLKLINSCKAGKEFIHMHSNGEIEDCCFRDNCFLSGGGKICK